MNVKDAISHISKSIQPYYDAQEAENIARLSLQHFLSLPPKDLSAHYLQLLSEDQFVKVDNLIRRLKQYEPIQYILEEAWFYNQPFYVNKNVLIPRPETEELVDWIIKDWKGKKEATSFEVGTGSGCISIILKKQLKNVFATACDISQEAISVAKKNAEKLDATVTFTHLDFLNKPEWDQLSQYDIIVSNPPYIPFSDKSEMDTNVLAFEPSIALFAPDKDGLIFYKKIADFGKTHLLKDGAIYCEIHENNGKVVTNIFEMEGFKVVLKKDMQKKARMIKASLKA